MTKLSVNINKIATLRNARGTNVPDVSLVAMDCERFGAQGITVHPRPDERHIRYSDVSDLKTIVKTEFNIEGFPDKQFIDLVLKTKPEQVTLVPDAPNVLTSNAGWDTIKQGDYLKEVISVFKDAGIRTSLFMAPDLKLIEASAGTETDRIELYTEEYARKYSSGREQAVAPYKAASKLAGELNIAVNAGHDLSLENLRYLKRQLPELIEVSIGHALICDALYYGLENTIQMYLRQLAGDVHQN